MGMFEGATLFNQGLGAWDVGQMRGLGFNNMFKGTTAMSDCNKKAIHNKFEAAPRSLNAWKVQRRQRVRCRHWGQFQLGIPEPGMLGTTKTHVAATELRRSCLAVDVASRRGSYRGYTNK